MRVRCTCPAMLRIALRVVAALAALVAVPVGYDAVQQMFVRPLTAEIGERIATDWAFFAVALGFAIGCAAIAQALQLMHRILDRLPATKGAP